MRRQRRCWRRRRRRQGRRRRRQLWRRLRWQRRRQGRGGEREKGKCVVGRDTTRLRGHTYLLRLRAGLVRAVVALATGPDGVPSCYAVRSPPWPFHRSAVIPRAAAGVPSNVVVATHEIVHLETPLLARTVCTNENLHHDFRAQSELRTGTGGGGSSDDRGIRSECDQRHGPAALRPAFGSWIAGMSVPVRRSLLSPKKASAGCIEASIGSAPLHRPLQNRTRRSARARQDRPRATPTATTPRARPQGRRTNAPLGFVSTCE